MTRTEGRERRPELGIGLRVPFLALVGSVLRPVLMLVGCGGVFAPRFPQDIAAALAGERMSRLEDDRARVHEVFLSVGW